MDIAKEMIGHPFVWGLLLGLFFVALALWSHFKTRREFRRYQKHLSDKMEIEAAGYEKMRGELEGLQKENENLRMQVAQRGEKPEQKIGRELEILARAEKAMVVRAPGFAPAWETAKQDAADELVAEEQGKSLPKRIFRKFFASGSHAGGGEMLDALPGPEAVEEGAGAGGDSGVESAEESAEAGKA